MKKTRAKMQGIVTATLTVRACLPGKADRRESVRQSMDRIQNDGIENDRDGGRKWQNIK